MPPGKTRITIRIDNAVLDWFRARVHESGGGSYQTLINDALREHMSRRSLEQTLRRVLKEELRRRARSPLRLLYGEIEGLDSRACPIDERRRWAIDRQS